MTGERISTVVVPSSNVQGTMTNRGIRSQREDDDKYGNAVYNFKRQLPYDLRLLRIFQHSEILTDTTDVKHRFLCLPQAFTSISSRSDFQEA